MKKYILTIIGISVYIYMNSINSLGSYISCGGVSIPTELASVTRIIIILLKYIAPLVLIIIGSLDFVRAVTGGNDSDIKDKQKVFFKRLIYGGLLFFVISLTQLTINIAADKSEGKNFTKCLKCMSHNDSDCDGTVEAPFDINNPEQGEVYDPADDFTQPEREKEDSEK